MNAVTLPSVHVTGSGVISCAGQDTETFWNHAYNGRSGLSEGLGRVSIDALLTPTPRRSEFSSARLSTEHAKSAALRFSMAAIGQAMARAGWTELGDEDGLILATTTGQIPMWDRELVGFLNSQVSRADFDRAFERQPLGSLIDEICFELGFSGRCLLTSTACTAATQALALGAQWLQQGRVRRCLVVGAEVLCTLTLEGFKSLQLLSPQTAKPFDLNRKGINLSEGAGALCLETGPAVNSRSMAQVSGCGMSTDSYHMTAPEPTGRGCIEAIQLALNSSRLQASDISWIHAHGTGSPHNDSAEGAAIRAVFGEATPPVSSTKNIHGHSLGASGAIESVLCLEAISRQAVIKTAGLETPDPKIAIRHVEKSEPRELKHVLKLTLGFGGANAAVIFSRSENFSAQRSDERSGQKPSVGVSSCVSKS